MTTLKVKVLPSAVAEAVLHCSPPTRSGKSSGNLLNVGGGVAVIYPG